jgi:hypothetical protein
MDEWLLRWSWTSRFAGSQATGTFRIGICPVLQQEPPDAWALLLDGPVFMGKWWEFHCSMGISMGLSPQNMALYYLIILIWYSSSILGSWSSHWNVQPCNFRGHLRRRCFLDASWWMSLDLQKIGPWSGILQWQQDEMVEDAKPSITRITQHFTGLPPTPQIPLGGNSVFTFHRGPIK